MNGSIPRARPGKAARRRSFRQRARLLSPFVVGGVAAVLLVRASQEPVIAVVGWLVSALAVATGFLLLTTAPPSDRVRRSRVRSERQRSGRWEARPIGSLLVRILVVMGPIGVSLATALAVQRALPAPRGGLGVTGQALLLMAVAFAVLYPAERATRRLAPIAMLLKLSLSFPSVAPSRFVVARRSANVGAVKQDLEVGRGDPAGNMLALVAALTAHDSRTRGHSERVRVFTEMLAQELGLDREERERLRWSALLHDIGKLYVSAAILNKPAKLDAAQWEAMYTHPAEGARLIAPLAPWLGEWASAVVEHHERLDGSGYPRGLSEGQISLGARIIAVADAYDTMVTPRTYHRPISASAAREEVVRASGMQFDPQVVRALLSISIPRLWWRIGIGAWLAQLPLLRPRAPKSSGSSASSGVASGAANIVGIAAIAVTAVLAPLGSIQNVLPEVPGLSTEASTPDGAASQPSEASTPAPSARPSQGQVPAPVAGAPAEAAQPVTPSDEVGRIAAGDGCDDDDDDDDGDLEDVDLGDDDEACDEDDDDGDIDDGGLGDGTGSGGAVSGGGVVVEANEDVTSASGGSGDTGATGGSGSSGGGGTVMEANEDATSASGGSGDTGATGGSGSSGGGGFVVEANEDVTFSGRT